MGCVKSKERDFSLLSIKRINQLNELNAMDDLTYPMAAYPRPKGSSGTRTSKPGGNSGSRTSNHYGGYSYTAGGSKHNSIHGGYIGGSHDISTGGYSGGGYDTGAGGYTG